jgi:lysyl-tRNA synthetase class 2
MKRLLAAGSGSIFRLGSVFRDDPLGSWHSPEFCMLEWYRCGFDDVELMRDVAELVAELGGPQRYAVSPYLELVHAALGADPLDAPLATLRGYCAAQGLQDAAGLGRDALLDFIMGVVIGPKLGHDQLQFVSQYPASQAALARLDPEQPATARRFELYWRGVELANGFWELTDPLEQAQRWQAEIEQRAQAGAPLLDADTRLLQALQAGLPDCAGVALGLDRLHALLEGATSLSAVQSFSWEVA